MARAAELQISQVGLETTLGGGATKFREPVAFSLTPSGKTERKSREPSGYLFPTAHKLVRETTEAKVEGDGSYYDLWYPLSSVIKKIAAGTFPSGVTAGAYQHYFKPSGRAADALQSYHVKHGDGTDNEEFKGAVFSDFSYTIDLSDFKWGGTMIGQSLNGTGVTLETGANKLATLSDYPAENTDVTVYFDGVAVDLVHKVEFKIGDRQKPVYTVKRTANGTMIAQVATKPKVEMKVTVAADSVGKALLTQMRSSSVVTVKVEAIGPAITGSTPSTNHSFIHTFKGVPSEPGEFKNSDGVYALEWSFLPQWDSGLDSAMEFTLVNGKQDYSN
ncbi:MAG: hypothetical protein U0641_05675 [Anaerolineae bacterium]